VPPDVASLPLGTIGFSRQIGIPTTHMSFSALGLSPKVLEALNEIGFTTPTAIQAEAIPHALQRRDVLGLAQTGSGKTAAFVLPMLTLLEKGRARARMPRTLILEPTRELAMQVQEAFDSLGRKHQLSVATLIGGVAFEPQAAKIDRGADVVIATPGRLLDHFERGKLLLTGIELLVIDEADRMLDMGFIPDIERICKLLPFTRQTLFFSATMPSEIQRLTAQFLHNPVQVETAAVSSTASTITQHAVKAPNDPTAKRDVLRALLRSQDSIKNAIIFANRKTTVAVLEKSLQKHGFNAGALHGDMDQTSRLRTLAAFRAQEITYLIASDVAARGLDIPEVSHVFNFDVPIHSEDYVHRIGRTGRAGREGHAYMMVTKADDKHFKAIESLIKKQIEWFNPGVAVSDDEPVAERAPRREHRGKGPRREERAREPDKKQAQHAPKPKLESVRQDAPRPPRRERPSNDDGPDHRGFHADNMPAFLQRPMKTA
jgi:superfamily II DNA/RNA helicase